MVVGAVLLLAASFATYLATVTDPSYVDGQAKDCISVFLIRPIQGYPTSACVTGCRVHSAT